jgi:3-oxoacyl-[acyl-carrier-protein] synthase I
VAAVAQLIAVGARTVVGLSAESAAAAVRAGISRVGEHPRFIDWSGNPLRCARDTLLKPSLAGVARMIQLASAALGEVIAKTFGPRPLSTPLLVLLALPEPRPGFGPEAADAVVRGVGKIQYPGVSRVQVEAVIGGSAGGMRALEIGAARVRDRHADACVVGGIDSYLDVDTLDWLESEGRVAREGFRGGFVPGEGAGMLVIAARGIRSTLGLRSLAQVRGVATVQEPRSIDSAEGLLGEGLTDAVRRATRELALPEECIDDVFCDINGERHRSDEWGFMMSRLATLFRGGSDYQPTTALWGDVGAASGVLGCVLAVQ